MKIETDHFETMEELIKTCKMWIKDDDWEAYNRFFEMRCMEAFIKELDRKDTEINKLNNVIDKLVRKIVGISDKDKDSTVSYQEMEELKKMRSEYEDLIRKAQDEY